MRCVEEEPATSWSEVFIRRLRAGSQGDWQTITYSQLSVYDYSVIQVMSRYYRNKQFITLTTQELG
jgi:hypothetical protein